VWYTSTESLSPDRAAGVTGRFIVSVPLTGTIGFLQLWAVHLRLLFVNKYLYPKGGSETHLLGLAAALGPRGHEIDFFGMEHAANVTTPGRTTTVPGTDYAKMTGWRARLGAMGGMIYSLTARRRVREYLKHARPDVAHLHNIYHQLSPSVLVALKKADCPCVLTAHDYKLVCPSYTLYDGQSACFACRGHRYWNVLARGCSRRGVLGDVALATEAVVHHGLGLYERNLDAIIAPSRFLRDRLVEGGFAASRVHVMPNAIAIEDYRARPEPGEYLLFVGRLSYEKGLPTLIAAARQARHVPLWLVGDGPLRGDLERQAADLSNVQFLGQRPHAEVRRLLEGCRAVVLPSVVPENCPLSLLEAFATAKPAIATAVGGVPELFDAEPTGQTVPPGDVAALAAAMREFWTDLDLGWHCGTQARQRVERQHNLANYVRELEELYGRVANHKRTDAADDLCEVNDEPPARAVRMAAALGRGQVY
jgi:glycosyltransferase involved in cell wall biosynthesis